MNYQKKACITWYNYWFCYENGKKKNFLEIYLEERKWCNIDVILNLNTGTHEPHNKPNNNPLNINIDSNHPPHIIKKNICKYSGKYAKKNKQAIKKYRNLQQL